MKNQKRRCDMGGGGGRHNNDNSRSGVYELKKGSSFRLLQYQYFCRISSTLHNLEGLARERRLGYGIAV